MPTRRRSIGELCVEAECVLSHALGFVSELQYAILSQYRIALRIVAGRIRDPPQPLVTASLPIVGLDPYTSCEAGSEDRLERSVAIDTIGGSVKLETF